MCVDVWMYRLERTCLMEGMYTCDGEAGMQTMCVANLRRLLNMHHGMYRISLIRHGDYYDNFHAATIVMY